MGENLPTVQVLSVTDSAVISTPHRKPHPDHRVLPAGWIGAPPLSSRRPGAASQNGLQQRHSGKEEDPRA